jgi:hypothetical protein
MNKKEFIAITGKSGEFSDEFKAIYNSPKLIWNFITEKVIPEAIAEHEAKGETCKWKRTTPKPGSGWLAECDKEDGFPFSNMLVMDYFKYCPFCGRKIERV